MPCYRCGVRQTDPGRGQSPWKRGVRRHSQILICPGCQDMADWMAELDRCARCSSVHLVKRLGEVECRDCGAIMSPEPVDEREPSGEAAYHEEPATSGPSAPGHSPGLSEEVARALDRVLGQSLVSQSIQRAPDPEDRAGRPGAGSAAGFGAGRHRAARASAEHHPAAHPAAERHRAARADVARRAAAGLDAAGPGAFAG